MDIKSGISISIYWFLSSLFILVILESLLTVFWENPYHLKNHYEQYTRLHPKGILAYLKVNHQLYGGNYRIRFLVDHQMAISNGLNQKNPLAISLGGSTTESALVPEGQRWSDLLTIPTLNYGVSGNTSIDGFYNLKFLIENQVINPQYVFMMFGINDLRAFLMKGVEPFKIKGWNEPLGNLLTIIDKVEQVVFFGLQIQDSSILSFLKYSLGNFFGRSFYQSYYEQRQAQEQLENLTDEEFNRFLKELNTQFLPQRKSIYLEINRFIKEYQLTLIFLTQPHAYREIFQPMEKDLRLFPIFQHKKMTLKQSAITMDIINNQTRALAQLLNEKLIDVEVCFSKLSPTPLFYDSVHYSLHGSRQFAQCVNQAL